MRHFMQLPPAQILPIVHAIQFDDGLWEDDVIRLRDGATKMPAWEKLPQVRPIIFDIMRLIDGTALGDVQIERLEPGKGQVSKGDGIIRYEVVLHALAGVTLTIGDEVVRPQPGEVWVWKIAGSIDRSNGSADDYVSLLIQADKE